MTWIKTILPDQANGPLQEIYRSIYDLYPPEYLTEVPAVTRLDGTAADTGTIYYARGSHAWGQLPTGDTFHAPDDWLGWMNEVRPEGLETEMVPIEVRTHSVETPDGSYRAVLQVTELDRQRYIDKSWRVR